MDQLSTDPLDGSPKYRALRELGRGGMGEVFLAEHRGLGTKVVIKLLHAELAGRTALVDRLRLEAQALARLSHPNIVRVTDFDRTPGGRPFFVMEYLPGRSLRDEVDARGGSLPLGEALAVSLQALEGLVYAHDAGLVHRDIKLDNLFVCDGPGASLARRAVKILDFGVAKVLDTAEDAPAPLAVPTRTGMVVGTPRFFAPEQARGQKLDHRADIYSMGMVIYWLVCGRGPFDDAKNLTDMAKAHVLRVPDPPSKLARQPLPAELDAVVLRCIAKKPEERYQNARELIEALRHVERTLADSLDIRAEDDPSPPSWASTQYLPEDLPGPQARPAGACGAPGSVIPGSVIPGSVIPGSVIPGSVIPAEAGIHRPAMPPTMAVAAQASTHGPISTSHAAAGLSTPQPVTAPWPPTAPERRFSAKSAALLVAVAAAIGGAIALALSQLL